MTDALGFFVTDGALPFTIAAAVLLGLLLVEALGILMLGTGLSHAADLLLHPHDADASGLVGALLGWLHWGKVPALAILAMFLAGFAASGWTAQWAAMVLLGGTALPALLASIVAVGGGLLLVRKLALPIARLLPGDHTTALSVDDMVGLSGEVTLAASAGSPGQARVSDRFGQSHYLRIVPAEGSPGLEPGQRIVVLERRDQLFAVADPQHYTPNVSNEILALLAEVARRPAGAVDPAEHKEKH